MKKTLVFIIFIISNFYLSQTNFVLKIKFNEGNFLSNFMAHRTENDFVLNVLKKTDSISKIENNSNYVVIMDSIMKIESNLNKEEKAALNGTQKKEFDSLKIEIDNGNFLKLMKELVKVNFGADYLEQTLTEFDIKNFKINQIDYNQISITFNDKENLEKVKNLLYKNKMSFHETLDEKELENIQNCFMKENDVLVKNFSLKKQNSILLISKDYINSLKSSKCFDSKKVTYLLEDGKDYEVYAKLYFVKLSNVLESKLINSIKGLDLQTKENRDDYADNYFFLGMYSDDVGKKYLNEYSTQNINKQIFIAKGKELLMFVNIDEKMEEGLFIVNGNLFEENWQDLYDLVKFEVFRNSIKVIQ